MSDDWVFVGEEGWLIRLQFRQADTGEVYAQPWVRTVLALLWWRIPLTRWVRVP